MKILSQKIIQYTMDYYFFCKSFYNDYRWIYYEKYTKKATQKRFCIPTNSYGESGTGDEYLCRNRRR